MDAATIQIGRRLRDHHHQCGGKRGHWTYVNVKLGFQTAFATQAGLLQHLGMLNEGSAKFIEGLWAHFCIFLWREVCACTLQGKAKQAAGLSAPLLQLLC